MKTQKIKYLLPNFHRLDGSKNLLRTNITRIIAIAITVGLSLFAASDSNAQTFDAVQFNPFSLTDIGTGSRPSLTDLNNDGYLDLMSGSATGGFHYFQNTDIAPSFDGVQSNPFSLLTTANYTTVSLGDLDGDGDLDLMAGGYFGSFYYFENTGTANAPIFGAVQTNPFSSTNIGNYSTPSFVDLDNDGDLDLMCGEDNGDFYYFENTGTASVPIFDDVQANPFSLTDIGNRSAPSFGDLDNDGDLDLMSGEDNGDFYYFENIGTASTPCFASVQINLFSLTNPGSQSAPSFGDLDGDGDLDLISGESNGKFRYFENITVSATPSSYTVGISDDSIIKGETATVTITFSEAVTGFSNDDLIVPNGTLSTVSSSDGNITFTATFTPNPDTEVACNVITLDNTGVTNGAGDSGIGTADSGNIDIDTKEPTVTITINDESILAGETATVTVSFSEAITGFDNSDLTVPNGMLSTVTSTDGNITFTATFTPTSGISDDTNTITLNNTGMTDVAGNTGSGTTDSENYTVDTIEPTATIVLDDTVITDGEHPTVTITFSEAVTGFTNDDLTVPNGVLSTVSSADGDITFVATYTPVSGITDATNVISIDNTGVTNATGNAGTGTTESDNFSIEQNELEIIFNAGHTNAFSLTDIGSWSAPTFVDLDGDGDLDLISGEDKGNFYYFKNIGTSTAPSFDAVQTNPFGLTDIGDESTPSFIDLDGDGDLDLMAGEDDGEFYYFENTGSATSPSFATVQTNPFSLTDIGKDSTPALVDLDGDGDMDLMAEESTGSFYYFENTGSVSSPSFETAQGNAFGLTDVGSRSAPSFTDLDGDGDMDLMTGERDGNFYYFENLGTESDPNFAPTQTNPFSLTDIGRYSTPSFADLDGDGDMDLIAGELYGNFHYFENISDNTDIVWDGETSTDWAEPTNWDGDEVPISTSTVTIPNVTNDPVITSDVEVKTIDIETDAMVTITTNSLKVEGTTTLDGNLTIASGASFIPIGSITGSGSANIKRNTSFGTEDGKYSVIGSPITGGSTSSLGGIVYSYDETIAYDAGGTDGSARFVAVNTPETMSIADAYFSANTGDITFTGMPNSEDIDVSLVYDETNDGATNAGFNLVSNPYTAAISYTDFVSDNTDIDGTIYLWDDGGSNTAARTNADYITINSVGISGGSNRSADWDGYIRSAQGFFVKANTAGTLNFTPSMMDVGNNSDDGFFRQAQPTVLRFSVSSSKSYNDILIAFSEKATKGLDRTMDAHKIRSNSTLALYSKSNESNLAIQALPIAKEQVTVDLGLDVAEAGTYTLTLEDAASYEFEVYLKDNKLDKMIDLSETNTYSFETRTVDGSDRFSLVFAPNQILSLDEEITKNELVVFSNENGLNVKVEAQISNATVRIYDLSGALIKQAEQVDFTQSNWTTGFNESGLFILTVQSKNEFLTKKFIKL